MYGHSFCCCTRFYTLPEIHKHTLAFCPIVSNIGTASFNAKCSLNFNAFCDAYIVQKQSYTMLLKSNRIFCLILGITFENNLLSISNEGDDHLWFYFVFFLNYPPMYEEIDC